MKATVYVTIKENVLDPQGKAVQGALHSMGFEEVGKVRIGKYMELELDTNDRARGGSAREGDVREAAGEYGRRRLPFRTGGLSAIAKFAVLVFPGSNCDIDCYKAVEETIGQPVDYVWHTATDLSNYDCDHRARRILLRRLSALRRDRPLRAGDGRGARRRRRQASTCSASATDFRFCRKRACCRARCCATVAEIPLPAGDARGGEQRDAVHAATTRKGEIIDIPIAHGEGNYYCDEETLAELEGEQPDRVPLRTARTRTARSTISPASATKRGNVVGMMPHPERAVSELLGSEDGKRMFTSVLNAWRERHGAAVTG